MSLKKLYQEKILEHNRSPRNFHQLPDASHSARGLNALCGDDLTVFLKIQNERIEDAAFIGDACAISMASASMMTELIKNKTTHDAFKLFEEFEKMMNGEIAESANLGEANLLVEVRKFPARIKSVKLAWHTLKAALEGQAQTTTEI